MDGTGTWRAEGEAHHATAVRGAKPDTRNHTHVGGGSEWSHRPLGARGSGQDHPCQPLVRRLDKLCIRISQRSSS